MRFDILSFKHRSCWALMKSNKTKILAKQRICYFVSSGVFMKQKKEKNIQKTYGSGTSQIASIVEKLC